MTKTIQEISDECNISIRKLNLLAKSGYLKFDGKGRKLPAQMTYYLKKGRMLTAEHLLILARDPDLASDLGNYEAAALKQVRSLGKIAADAMPGERAPAMIYGAHIADPMELARAAEWLRSVIPAKGCGYHYIAVRMLWNVPENRFKECYAFVARALINMRRHPLLAGMTEKDDKDAMRFVQPKIFHDL